jgi:outer membrane lipoprotein-sorting protein
MSNTTQHIKTTAPAKLNFFPMKLKILTTLFSLLATISPAADENNTVENPIIQPELLIPLKNSAQMFQKFDLLHSRFNIERSLDNGKSWEKTLVSEIVLDFKNSKHYGKTVMTSAQSSSYVELIERAVENGVETVLRSRIKHSEALRLNLKPRASTSFAEIEKSTMNMESRAPINFRISRLIDTQNLFSKKNTVRLVKDENGKALLEIQAYEQIPAGQQVSETFIFDVQTGYLIGQKEELNTNGKIIKLVESKFTNYTKISGIPFPRIATRTFYNGDGSYRATTRVTVEELNINDFLPDSRPEFKVEIPVGANVRDEIKKVSYKKSPIDENLTEESISSELDKIFESGKK